MIVKVYFIIIKYCGGPAIHSNTLSPWSSGSTICFLSKGSAVVDKQVERQRLGQHWFIISAYIVVYIQGLYTVYNGAGVRTTVAVLGLGHELGV
jgi:hypothetical protein